MSDIINEITEKVSMRDIFSYYGFKPNRAGFICCPFHNEKTPSLKIYSDDKKFHCFGCGEGGSVIDFVMKLFNLPLRQALIKIDYDFNLNSIRTTPLNTSERRKIEQREKERQKQRKYKEDLKQAEKSFFDVLCELEKVKKEFVIKTHDDITDLYVYLIKKIDYYQYICEYLESVVNQIGTWNCYT